MTKEFVNVRTTCRLCSSPRLVLAVPLVGLPIISPNMSPEASSADGGKLATITAPLECYLCEDCGLNQLIHVVDPSLTYRDYLYRTTVSKGLAEHFRGLADTIVEKGGLKSGDLVVEFGSNDGTLLSFFQEFGMSVQGVDPATAIAEEASARGIPTIADFFTSAVAQRIRDDLGPAKAIIANNCMANIDDLGEIFRGIEKLLADDGIFVMETQYGLDIFEKFLLDVVYHEHITNFSVRPLRHALPRYGLELFDAEGIAPKGGSLRLWVQKSKGPRQIAASVAKMSDNETKKGLYDLKYLRAFADRAAALGAEIQKQVAAVHAKGGKVAVYGTSVGCVALIHQFEIQNKIDYLLDDKPLKKELVGPGYRLPVHIGSDLSKLNPDLVLILAWRYADPITAQHDRYLAQGGRFVVPLPTLTEIRRP